MKLADIKIILRDYYKYKELLNTNIQLNSKNNIKTNFF